MAGSRCGASTAAGSAFGARAGIASFRCTWASHAHRAVAVRSDLRQEFCDIRVRGWAIAPDIASVADIERGVMVTITQTGSFAELAFALADVVDRQTTIPAAKKRGRSRLQAARAEACASLPGVLLNRRNLFRPCSIYSAWPRPPDRRSPSSLRRRAISLCSSTVNAVFSVTTLESAPSS
jgi:hypothetical protein